MSDCKVVSEEFEDLMEGTEVPETFDDAVDQVVGPDPRVTPVGEQPAEDPRVTPVGEQPAEDPRAKRPLTAAELEAQRQARPPVHERRTNNGPGGRAERLAERARNRPD